MKDALSAALAGRAAVIFAHDAADLASLRTAATDHAMVLLVLAPTVPKLDRAMLLATIGPLAVELAPGVRIGAIELEAGANIEDVVAAAVFLATAESTTGQVLQVTPR